MHPLALGRLEQAAAAANAGARKALQAVAGQADVMRQTRQELAEMQHNMAAMQDVLTRVDASRSGQPDIQYVENIPGRRVPFDLLVDIQIQANTTSVQTGTITISQDGPFVAVARVCCLLSYYEFQFVDPDSGETTTFNGRSYGRFRPVSSVWDLNDGQVASAVNMAVAMPGTGAPHVASPSNASPFRSMEGDFRIKFENAGSGYPRSNLEVPSALWSHNINEPFALGALDVFERGEVLKYSVLPMHSNNQAFGNVFGFGVPNTSYPYVDAQWDHIEGVSDPNDPDTTEDPMTRLPTAIMTIGFHGYKIIQPPGVSAAY
jgi:hypothetical protein